MIWIFKKLELFKTWDAHIIQANTRNTWAKIQGYIRKISNLWIRYMFELDILKFDETPTQIKTELEQALVHATNNNYIGLYPLGWS